MQKQYFPEIIPFNDLGKWGFTDSNKNILIGLKYDLALPFVGEIAKVQLNQKFGLVAKDGTEILAPVYDEVGGTDGYFLYEDGSCSTFKDEKYGLVSCEGEILAEASFASPDDAYDHAVANGWQGQVPADYFPSIPKKVLNGIQEIKSFQNGIAPFKQHSLWGLISEEGKIIVEAQYEQISPAENGYWPFSQHNQWGLLNQDGSLLLEPKFQKTRGFSNGQAACMDQGLWGAVNQQGNWIFPPQFTELGEFRDGLSAAQQNGLFGFVDEFGNQVIDFQFQDVMDYHEGVCVVFQDQFIYFMDKNGQRLSENYIRFFGPNKDHWFHVVQGEKWGLVQSNRKFILPIEYDLPKAMGQVIQVIEGGMIPIKKGAFLGYANTQGEEIVPPKYIVVDGFTEERSLVSIQDPKYAQGMTPEMMEATGSISGLFLYGFIDRNGSEVVPPKYRLAKRFDHGLAYVETTDSKSGFINYDGEEYFN